MKAAGLVISQLDGVYAYAKMMNNLDVSYIEPYLADDFQYVSQWVFSEITSKEAYLDYIRPKLCAIAKSGAGVFAEVASWRGEPCAVVAQGDKGNLVATVLLKVMDGHISSINMCAVPTPLETVRSGEYPK